MLKSVAEDPLAYLGHLLSQVLFFLGMGVFIVIFFRLCFVSSRLDLESCIYNIHATLSCPFSADVQDDCSQNSD